ncbi:hypothetical protein D3C80_2011230 [compost metagenome]
MVLLCIKEEILVLQKHHSMVNFLMVSMKIIQKLCLHFRTVARLWVQLVFLMYFGEILICMILEQEVQGQEVLT